MPEVGRELHLEDEIPGRDEPPFERVEIDVQLPGRFIGRFTGCGLSQSINFLLVCLTGVGVGAISAFMVDAPVWIAGVVMAGTSIAVVCLGLFWLSRHRD